MTPLAHRLAKQLTLPPREREPFWAMHSDKLRRSLEDIHCFEVTEVLPLLDEVGHALLKAYPDDDAAVMQQIGRYSFLPAPKTWIEFLDRPDDGRPAWRTAFHLQEMPDEEGVGPYAWVQSFSSGAVVNLGAIPLLPKDSLLRNEPFAVVQRVDTRTANVDFTIEDIADILMECSCLLMLINSPRIIGRKTFMPHAGLQKKLRQQLGPGKFPLNAWTEIKLQVSKPPEIDDGEPHETHLTGKRALHFCRKHIRIRLGKLEYVTAHWRGDPALGIRQSRYLVT
jgi:hypothetical protein